MIRRPYLWRRGGRLYYRRAMPKELWPVTGKAPFQRALGTDSAAEAQRSYIEAEREYLRRLDQARLMLASRADRPGLSRADAEALVSQTFLDRLREDEEWLALPSDPEQLNARIESAESELAETRQRLAERDFERSQRDRWKQAAERAGFSLEVPSPEWDYLLTLAGRMDIAALEVHLARLVADYSRRPGDAFFASLMDRPDAPPAAPAEAGPKAARKRTVGDLEAAFRTDRFPHLSEAERIAYAPVFRLLRDTMGKTKPLSDIGRDEGRLIFETVKALPKGLGKSKALRGMGVLEAVEAGKRLGLPTLSPKSINSTYMGRVRTIFGWAVREHWLERNPVEGLTVKDPVADQDKRDPFSLEQLQALFAGDPWKPRDEAPDGRPIRYWGPLIALFHGLRRGEIAQLKTEDIETTDGVPALHVRGDQLKTRATRRTLALHPELIRLGLLDYVEKQRQAGEVMLFSGEEPNIRGQWGDHLSDWFSRHVQAKGFAGRGLGMHSFRHSFQDALRRAGLHDTPLGNVLAGRAGRGDPVAGAYCKGFPLAQLREAIERVTYPGLKVT